MNRTLPINRMQKYFLELEWNQHHVQPKVPPGWVYTPVKPLVHVGDIGRADSGEDLPFIPGPQMKPGVGTLRKVAPNEYRSEPAQEYVVGTTLLIVAGAGVGLLFLGLGTYWLAELGAFVCAVVGRLFGGLR